MEIILNWHITKLTFQPSWSIGYATQTLLIDAFVEPPMAGHLPNSPFLNPWKLNWNTENHERKTPEWYLRTPHSSYQPSVQSFLCHLLLPLHWQETIKNKHNQYPQPKKWLFQQQICWSSSSFLILSYYLDVFGIKLLIGSRYSVALQLNPPQRHDQAGVNHLWAVASEDILWCLYWKTSATHLILQPPAARRWLRWQAPSP